MPHNLGVIDRADEGGIVGNRDGDEAETRRVAVDLESQEYRGAEQVEVNLQAGIQGSEPAAS